MKIQVDFYKDTGKWYSGGIVDIGDTCVYSCGAVEQAIVDHQDIMADGWSNQRYYYVVVNNTDDNDAFCMRLYKPMDFYGIVKG